jgi:iron(III) transport system permease protein
MLSLVAASICVAVALTVAYAKRIARSPFMTTTGAAAGLGYALPGTILALGLLYPLAAFDNRVDALLRATLGISSGLLVSGGIGIVVFAYVIRFLSVSLASIDSGLDRLSPNLDAAARALGETAWSALLRVHVPLLAPALGAAALLVFVDCMKELPATLLLRPFDFDTLATHVYALAALEQFEAAAVGALAIVAAGLVPLLLLHRAIAGGRV